MDCTEYAYWNHHSPDPEDPGSDVACSPDYGDDRYKMNDCAANLHGLMRPCLPVSFRLILLSPHSRIKDLVLLGSEYSTTALAFTETVP
jgi:hypothetical protein